ncbi:class I SAM-dependent methyltransferase [Vandammella animalimorsus]|uniref:class I SAM-dependent methyltransferase n=1 Tax=Vandammella animalimorsus TaxID=2029117 RepID=UPI00325B0744
MKKYDSFFGPELPEHGWVPAPRYLLRRNRIKSIVQNIHPKGGRLLEIGPGAGALLVEFSDLGYQCTALESSLPARDLMRKIFQKYDCKIDTVGEPGAWSESFDMICAFEVLEHIEDHEDALKTWRSWLKPNGRLLLSVPSHMKAWNYRDVWAGHFRRYEKKDLSELLIQQGFSIEKFESYGYPIGNLIDLYPKIQSKTTKRKYMKHGIQKSEATAKSGIERKAEMRLYWLQTSGLGKFILQQAYKIQDSLVDTDKGNGYLVYAKKSVQE